jgi:DNA repair exonuclease SbcCD nuclease subunit
LTIKFAHIADTHLGAFRDPTLRRLNLEAFLQALRVVEEERVDFILLAGDLFDSPLPDMSVVQEASRGLQRLREAGIRSYAFHGSHDRSPTESAILDVLAETRLFQLVDAPAMEGDGVTPVVVTDKPTGTVIAAVGGLRGARETAALDLIDGDILRDAAAGAPLAVFGFHGSVQGMLPQDLDQIPAVSQKTLPPGFGYYALGHIHHRMVTQLRGGAVAAYPGPPFGATFTDLANGLEKGILVVEVDDAGECEVRPVPIESAPVMVIDLDVGGLSVDDARDNLSELSEDVDVEGGVVLLRAHGVLASGRPSELGIPSAREALLGRGALTVHVSRMGLRSATDGKLGPSGDGAHLEPAQVFHDVLEGRIDEHHTDLGWLKGDDGLALANELFKVLSRERGSRKVEDHKEALRADAMAILGTRKRMGGEPR